LLFGVLHWANALILGGITRNDMGRLIGGITIYDDEFPMRIGLLQNALDGVFKIFCAVQRWQDHRDKFGHHNLILFAEIRRSLCWFYGQTQMVCAAKIIQNLACALFFSHLKPL
jgi:hypothetical protein